MTKKLPLSGLNATISKEKALGFLLPVAMAVIFILFSQYRYQNLYGDLDQHGRTTQATIIDKQIIRKGAERPKSAYQMTVGFTVGEKMLRGGVWVTSDFYDQHNSPERVEIRYLPDDPSVREIDPAMRDQSAQRNLSIVLIFILIAFVNLFMVGNKQVDKTTA